MTAPTEARADLVEALIQSCWLVETARANVLAEWGGQFGPDADGARERADRILDVLATRDIEVPEHVADAHTAWIRSLCGSRPDEVPLGAGVVHRLGDWTNVYIAPYLDDADTFRTVGEAELRFPVEPRDMERHEAVLPTHDLPPGRRFVIFTDIHIGAPHAAELARRTVEDINAVSPEFVLCPGDITDDGEPDQYSLCKEILDGIDAPTYAVLGNHDAVRRSTVSPEGAELFAERFGEPPRDRVLEIGGLQVALVDTTDPTPSPFPDWDLARGGFRDDAGGTNNGALGPGQAEALASRIDPARPALLVLHHELQPFAGFPPVMFGIRRADSDALVDALSGHRLVGIVAGHTHRSARTEVDGGLPQLEIPSLKDWPYCHTVVGVDDIGAHVSVRQLSDPDLVWERAREVPPIYLNYVLGPLSAPEHTFRI